MVHKLEKKLRIANKKNFSFRPYAEIIKHIFISFYNFTGMIDKSLVHFGTLTRKSHMPNDTIHQLFKFLYLTNYLTGTCLKCPKKYFALEFDTPNYTTYGIMQG